MQYPVVHCLKGATPTMRRITIRPHTITPRSQASSHSASRPAPLPVAYHPPASAARPPGVRSRCRFRNRGTDYLSGSGKKWLSDGATRQCDRALAATPPRSPVLTARLCRRPDGWPCARKGPYYTVAHTTPHTTLCLNKNREVTRQRKLPRPSGPARARRTRRASPRRRSPA